MKDFINLIKICIWQTVLLCAVGNTFFSTPLSFEKTVIVLIVTVIISCIMVFT